MAAEGIIEPLFNTRDPTTKLRQYRTCYVEVPRKNAKSTAAGLALYALYGGPEPGAQIISAAADRQQAAIVFDIASHGGGLAGATERAQDLPAGDCTSRLGFAYRSFPREAYSKHGLNLSAAMVDELHAHESPELLDVLLTTFGSRRQPFLFIITTAGFDRGSVCWAEHELAEKVKSGVVRSDLPPGLVRERRAEDWTDPACGSRMNPGYGVTIKADYLASECRRAQQMPSYENAFKRLHLDMWTESESRWLSMAHWARGAVPVDPEALRERPCYLGVDLSSTHDSPPWWPSSGARTAPMTCSAISGCRENAGRSHQAARTFAQWATRAT